MTIDTTAKDSELAKELVKESGQNPTLCYQCKKCTAGCPLSDEMDLTPNQVLRALQFGQLDKVLRSKTIWVCAACQTCTMRCPQSIDIAGIMDSLKVIAQRRGIPSPIPAVSLFVKATMRNIKLYGRMHEATMTAEMNLRLKQPTREIGLAKRLMQKGRLRILPELAGYPRNLKSVPTKTPAPNSVAYYPGCSLHASSAEFDESTKAVAAHLGIQLDEPKGWLCCGNSAVHWYSKEEAIKLPLKNLALIEKMGHTTVTVPCASCFSRLRFAAHDVKGDPSLKEQTSRETGYTYQDGVQIEHTVDTFIRVVGLSEIKQEVKKPLTGLKVACYYGCLLTRPAAVTGSDHSEYPMNMDYLIRSLGATTVDWEAKTDCCGASHSITQKDVCLDLVGKILSRAKEAGAEAVVVGCPLCHLNLDSRQLDIAQKTGQSFGLPIFYFTQLLGLALGLPEKELALKKLLTDGQPLLAKKGLL